MALLVNITVSYVRNSVGPNPKITIQPTSLSRATSLTFIERDPGWAVKKTINVYASQNTVIETQTLDNLLEIVVVYNQISYTVGYMIPRYNNGFGYIHPQYNSLGNISVGYTKIGDATTSSSSFEIQLQNVIEISQLNFTVPPTTEIHNINLMSSFGGINIEPSATENTYGTWPMSYGTNITLTALAKLGHLLLTPKVSTKPNVSQKVDVTVDGTTTTYPLTQNPNIYLWAGKDVKVEVSSPAPTVTVDYTNTTTPVITDTPTGG